MKRFALLMVLLTLLAPPALVLAASFEDANGPKDKKTDKQTDKEKGKTVPVPEPATIALLAAGAGVVAARKLWGNRQR
jgi:hypothetical protein